MAQNVRAIRRSRGMELSGLADRLEALGQPVGVPGLSRLENGERRVDVDDLVALALALGVAPLRLLLPEISKTGDGDTPITSKVVVTDEDAWQWGLGLRPIPTYLEPGEVDWEALLRRFVRENQPFINDEDPLTTAAVLKHREVLQGVQEAVERAVEEGLSYEQVIEYVRFAQAVSPLMEQLDNLPGRRPASRSTEADGQPE